MNIVMVPFHDYKKWLKEGFRTRDAHLCEHFEKNEEVKKILVVNRPTSLAEMLLKRQNWKTPNGKVVYKKNGIQLSQMSEKVWCVDFILMDFIKVALQKKMWWFTAFNYKKVLNGINQAINALEMGKPVLLLQNPMAIGAAKKVQNSSFVFDAIDNWLYHPQMKNKDIIKENYEFVDEHADLIMTVSEALTETFPNNKNVHWVPNGVDVDFFANGFSDYQESRNIVVGYVGKIQDRVDLELVEKCVLDNPEVEFLFMGPIYAQKEKIATLEKKYANIHFVGDIHYNSLPEMFKGVDITIIPHIVDRFTNSMNPLKLYEYLAAGKPIVTTKVAGVEGVSEYVKIADSQDEFCKKLKCLMQQVVNHEIQPEKVAMTISTECTWEYRSDVIIKLLKNKKD